MLRKSEAALRQAQRLGNIGSFQWEIEADIVVWSEELYRLFGLDAARLPPSYAEHARLYTPPSWERLDAAVEACRCEGVSYCLELEYVRADGTHGWLEARGVAERDEEGAVIAINGTAQDISRRIDSRGPQGLTNSVEAMREPPAMRNERSKVLERELAQAKKLETLGMLAGSVAHDFNNVLAGVSAAFNLLDRRLADPRSKELIELGQRNVHRATRLVRQLMGFARTNAVDAEVVEIGAVIEACTDLLMVCGGSRVRLTLNVVDRCHAHIDPSQFEMVLLNLVINARDAMPAGGELTINVYVLKASVDTTPSPSDGGHVAIELHDTGVGMSAEVLARIREPFFTTKERGAGTGLGMPMVYAFAERSGGTLVVESVVGQGTTVTLVLPLARVPDSVAPTAMPVSELPVLDDRPRGAAPPPSGPPAQASGVATRIKHASLRATYGAWSRSRDGAALPPVAALQPESCADREHMFVAAIDDVAPFTYRRIYVGEALLRRMAADQVDAFATTQETDAFGGIEAAYRRCARTREPTYEFMRFRLENDADFLFERLLLPCADPTTGQHQLVGMVVISDGRKDQRNE